MRGDPNGIWYPCDGGLVVLENSSAIAVRQVDSIISGRQGGESGVCLYSEGWNFGILLNFQIFSTFFENLIFW